MKTIEQDRAASHFGLGVCRADLSAMGDDPRGWLELQLTSEYRTAGPAVAPSQATLVRQGKAIMDRRRARQADAVSTDRAPADQRDFRRISRDALADQTLKRFQFALDTLAPFRERLVRFYSNHFSVSQQGKPQLIGSCVAYENEAIRTSLDGRFSDMLVRAVSHPVMLLYLDNARSAGPDSMVGRRRKVGLNENLAREIMELHTLGVDGGYDQEDVKALAGMLTGWTVGNERLRRVGAEPGAFAFVDPMHQPGSFRLLGKRYPEGGVKQGREALADLAVHPATANFLAGKLVRHFVASDASEASIGRVAQVFRESGGHLPAVHLALIGELDAWDPGFRKFKTPEELMLSVYRGLDLPMSTSDGLLGPLRLMNHLPFSAPSPAGWSDEWQHWAAPASLKQRMEWAVAVGGRAANGVNVREAIETVLPVSGSERLAKSLSRSESQTQALALMLASPEFQWR
jgi:uncharacterized protein (DUF1800 family)